MVRLMLAMALALISGIALSAFTSLGESLQHSALGSALAAAYYSVPRPCVDIYAGHPLSPVYQVEDLEPGSLPISGLAHKTLAGRVHHGTRSLELWMETLSPGAATPIHRHDCEEVLLVLKGTGVVRIQAKDGSVVTARLQPNSTFTVLPNARHQVENDGPEDLQVIAAIDRAPIKVYAYRAWEDPYSSGQLVFPIFWDRQCPQHLPASLAVLKAQQASKQEL